MKTVAKNLSSGVTLILKKALPTTSNVLALPKNWETEQERDVLMAILAMLTKVWVILNKL